jgi:hypothetical protein
MILANSEAVSHESGVAERHRAFVLQYVQPALAGLIDGWS